MNLKRALLRYFLLYEKFPWNHSPQPAFSHIRLIEWEKRTAEEEAFIKQLEHQFIDGLNDAYIRLTPDYLLGWVYHSGRSNWSGQPDYYCVMPLGYIHAEVSLPHPDWKPFIIGHMLKEALATALGTTAPAGGPYLEDRYYLYVRGWEVEVLPQVEGVARPDLAISRGEERVYVEVETGTRLHEANTKWRLNAELNGGKVALVARNVEERQVLVADCRHVASHGMASDVETLILSRFGEVGANDPLWAEVW